VSCFGHIFLLRLHDLLSQLGLSPLLGSLGGSSGLLALLLCGLGATTTRTSKSSTFGDTLSTLLLTIRKENEHTVEIKDDTVCISEKQIAME
jgi:hypothetical protein